MIKKIKLIVIFSFLMTCNVYSQWISQVSNTTNDLNSVVFVNGNTGFAVGSSGTVRKTTNAGQTWFIVNLGDDTFLSKIIAVDKNSLYAVGSLGKIFFTSDQGLTWFLQASGTSTTLSSVYFINNLTGFVVGNSGLVRKTSNGGTNWQNVTTITNSNLYDVKFINQNTGFIVGNFSTLLKSTNGGITWATVVLPNTSQRLLLSIDFADENNGTIIKNNDNNSREIFRTTNGGNNWFTMNLGSVNSFRQVQFIDTANGFIIGDQGNFFRTFNGGTNWYSYPTNTSEWLYSVNFVNPDTGWAVGRNGKIIFTKSGSGGIPSAPSNLSAFPSSETTIFLSWQDNSFNESGFRIERADSNLNNFTDIATVGANMIFYFDNTGLISGNTYRYRVAAFNSSGISGYSNVFEITLVNIEPISTIIPERFQLYNNYPNPFNPETKIKFDVPKLSHVMIEVFNIKGELVSELVNSNLNEGQYEVIFNSSGLSSGLFFYRMISDDFVKTGKMILLK